MGCSGVKPREFDNLLFYKEILGASSSQEIRNEIRAYYKERWGLLVLELGRMAVRLRTCALTHTTTSNLPNGCDWEFLA